MSSLPGELKAAREQLLGLGPSAGALAACRLEPDASRCQQGNFHHAGRDRGHAERFLAQGFELSAQLAETFQVNRNGQCVSAVGSGGCV